MSIHLIRFSTLELFGCILLVDKIKVLLYFLAHILSMKGFNQLFGVLSYGLHKLILKISYLLREGFVLCDLPIDNLGKCRKIDVGAYLMLVLAVFAGIVEAEKR